MARKYLADYIEIYRLLTGEKLMYEDTARRRIMLMCKTLREQGIIDGARIEKYVKDKSE